MKHPQKKHFRSRAHCNPLAHNDGFNYPVTPLHIDWSLHYPNVAEQDRVVKYLDIGMGFGGLTIALAELDNTKLVMGMEIRAKVCEYVRLRIEALRTENHSTSKYQNCSCLRTNCMRYLPNYFKRGQLEKIFICFPDPHFKTKNHRRRIISYNLLSEYAYFLNCEGNGFLYLITDVKDLHDWHVSKCEEHPCFERIPDITALEEHPCVKIMMEETEESKKVARIGGAKYFAVYRRKKLSELPTPAIFSVFNNLSSDTS